MANAVGEFFEKIGHGIAVVFEDGKTIEQKIVEVVKVAEDAVEDAPLIVADVAALSAAVAGGKALEATLMAVLSQLGTNAVSDISLLSQIVAQLPNYKTYLATVEASFVKLLTDLKVDEKQIAAIFAPSIAA